MPSPNPMVIKTVSNLPSPSGSTPTVTTLGPTVSPPTSGTTLVPFSNPFDWNPLLSSNPLASMPGGNVTNTQVAGNISLPLQSLGQIGQPIVNNFPLSGSNIGVGSIPLPNYASSSMPPGSSIESIWANPPQPPS